ncbi:acyl-CoA:lysophosphatidylglycerol acyltransferase 1-like [Chrysoperla carnea]|uniref:acyl-CoA:lysophosphatidylglycerol acyltransferase 1-like n=1 Tax=Chrysoperla carnea TaxID=189513 RepID=UPI001D062125|nr:acyl-CoA:lysophosphatidylglycerol acyltransferase 1-like [Chrysoperla carnea]
MDNILNSMSLIHSLRVIPKAFLRTLFVLLNNAYCIPTYVIWMILLFPLRKLNPDAYWRIEGYFFHWLLAMVSMWSWSAGYDIVEMGDDIRKCLDERTLVIVNHQSTADVPMLMACFNAKPNVLPNIMWIMDRVFKFTNFGIVSVMHKDFFIVAGKNTREKSLLDLTNHLYEVFIPLQRKWMVLFPEGGFLRKRRATSQRYAVKNNLPVLYHVTLPRIGAMKNILSVMSPNGFESGNNNVQQDDPRQMNLTPLDRLTWVVDITVAYPEGQPLDLPTIVFGNRQPCKTLFFYRTYRIEDLPKDEDSLFKWLCARFVEKEEMLETFYRTGYFPYSTYSKTPMPPQEVSQDCLRFVMLHLFFIASTYIHYQMFYAAYEYYTYLTH